ncbi:MAG TPA: enoyl-CoA hydratase-related protein [Flavobacteriales bacterium]|jgi:2-(1,2-epoxy-1,2-dihydrophenyl)acetyl-CoA isomerase|nr:enoyl-CoA hydratase-related protein [Flavobacteriales bacterium]
MTYEKLRYALADGVATLTLDRPDKLNSFDRQMSDELLHALDTAKNDANVRAIVLTGEGRAFCAGQDLAEATAPGVRIEQIVEAQYNAIVRAIRSTPKPVLAMVNGVAAGAGANIAYACDLAFAGESANFIQSFINIGLIPDSGGTHTVPRLIGMQRAFGHMILAEKLPAAKAAELGLIWKAVPDADLRSEVETVAKRLALLPTKAIALTKQALDRSANNTLEEQLAVEGELQAIAGASADSKEGVNAFLEKRKPAFTGA